MGSAARTLDINMRMVGVDAVRAGFQRVRTEARQTAVEVEGVGKAGEGISHGAIFGLAEFSRGLGRIADTGQASSLAMRELSGGVMRLGQALGPGAGIIGILALFGGVIYEHFQKAREEIVKTQNTAIEALENIAKAGDLASAAKTAQYDFSGTPGAMQHVDESAEAFLARSRGIQGLRKRIEAVTDEIVRKYGADRARTQADASAFAQGGVPLNVRPYKETEKLIELYKQLNPLVGDYNRALALSNSLAAKRVGEVTAGIKEASEKKGLKNLFNESTVDWGNLITGEQYKRSAIGHMLPGQIGDMNRPLKDQLKQELDVQMISARGAKTTDERTAALKRYAEVLKEIDDLEGKPGELGVLGGKGPKIATITPTDTQQIVADFQKNVNEPLAKQVKEGLGRTLGTAIADGITAGFQSRSIGGAFKGMGKAILAGLGSVFEQMGETMITFGIAATGFAKAMLNPLTAGPSAIAYGALLVALGASLGAIAQGRSGGYGGGSSVLPSIDTTTYLTTGNAGSQGSTMTPKGAGTTNVWVIGTDAKAWRDVQQQLDRNARLSGS